MRFLQNEQRRMKLSRTKKKNIIKNIQQQFHRFFVFRFSFVLCLVVDVAAAATFIQQNADRYKSMEIVAVVFVLRIRQKIEIQNKLLIIPVPFSIFTRKKKCRQICRHHDNNDAKATITKEEKFIQFEKCALMSQ